MNRMYDDYETPLSEPRELELFEGYIQDLNSNEIFNTRSSDDHQLEWQNWQNHFRNFYKKIINDAFDNLQIEVPSSMEVHFAGSLAKNQATPYSDLDAFVLVENESDIEKVKKVFQCINNLCIRIFHASNQCFPDPIGINPAKLIGTIDNIIDFLDNNTGDTPSTVRSIISSRPIFGEYKLAYELKNKIRSSPLSTHFTAETLYNEAIEKYKAPRSNATEINIKSAIMRPIDFILMGLREELNIDSEDGSHLTLQGTLTQINEGIRLGIITDHILSPEDEKAITEIVPVYFKAILIRCNLHRDHKNEFDTYPADKALDMLEKVENLRQMAVRRKAALTIVKPSNLSVRLETRAWWVKYQNLFKGLITFNLALIGGVIGFFLIPIPGLGSILGSLAASGVGAMTGLGFGLTSTSIIEFFRKNVKSGTILSLLGTTGLGAGIGALLGTFIFPGIGTAVGAGIGAGLGGTLSLSSAGILNALFANYKTAFAFSAMGSGGIGAGIGAIIGTLIFPVIGTLLGAGVGAGIGAISTVIATSLAIGLKRIISKHLTQSHQIDKGPYQSLPSVEPIKSTSKTISSAITEKPINKEEDPKVDDPSKSTREESGISPNSFFSSPKKKDRFANEIPENVTQIFN